jgi:Protein of unknown function (DUF541)
MMRVALLTAVLLAILPAPALAQGPFFFGPFAPPQEEYGPGISVDGAGLARVTAPARLTEESVGEAVDAVRPRAVARAVGDARRRAEAIAGALGLSLGSAEAVELGGGFPEREPCRRLRRTGEVRCRVPAFTTASATVTFAIVGGAKSSEGAREISATALGSALAEPKEQTSPSIRHALFVARSAATPEAATKARANAELAAQGSGLALGPLFSIVEQQNLYGYQPILGAFAPGTYCRSFRRRIVRRDPDTGLHRVVGRRRVRRCFAPSSFQVSLEATYLAQGS